MSTLRVRGRKRVGGGPCRGVVAGLIGGPVALAAVVGLALPGAAVADGPTDYSRVVATLSREIPQQMKAAQVVGLSIALVDGDRTVWARGFGWADRVGGVPVTADTLFHIGSVAKTMSAAAVMQLVEQGRVDLDAPLARYVPEFALLPRFPGSTITVRSVLDMHSGIPGDVNNGLISVRGPDPGYRDFLLEVLAREFPERPVDTAWAYSNSGFALLQNLVENVTGQGFDAYTREHLFGPMGMPSTTFDDAAVPEAALAHGYDAVTGADGAVRALERPREYVNGSAAGSVVSSATDMAAYLKTMIARGAGPGGRILADSTVQEMITPQTRLPLDIVPFRAGLGWNVGDAPNAWMGKAAYWDGDTANFHTFVRWLPDAGLGVFVGVNTTSAVNLRDQVGLRALSLMVTAKTGRTAPSPPRPARVVRVSTRTLRRAAGRYASGAGVDLVKVSGGGLRYISASHPPGLASQTLLPRADGWYAAAHPPPGNPVAAAWIRPATVAGRHLMLSRLDGLGGASGVSAAAETIPFTYRIPKAWKERTGSYRAISIRPRTYPGGESRVGRLTIDHGVLVWHTIVGGAPGGKVVAPAGPRRAFTFGFTSFQAERGAGDVLTPAGDTLTLLGTTYRRLGR
jgi:CubicO group peptidase (beta-lactamase class C family)